MDNYRDYRKMASEVASRGRLGDSMLMHINPVEVHVINELAPDLLTTNPDTGYPEAIFGIDDAIIAAIALGIAGGAVGGTQAKKNDIPVWQGILGGAALGGMGGYAGAGALGLGGAGAGAGAGLVGGGTLTSAEMAALGGTGAQMAPYVAPAALSTTAPVAAAGGLGSTEAMMALGAGSIAADALQPGMKDPWEGSGGDFKGPYASWSYGYQGEEDDPGQLADADWGEGYEDEDEEYSSLA